MIYNKASLSVTLSCGRFLHFLRRSVPMVLCDTTICHSRLSLLRVRDDTHIKSIKTD